MDKDSDASVMIMESIEEKIPKKKKKESSFQYRTTFKLGRDHKAYHKAHIEHEESLLEDEEDSDEEFLVKIAKEQCKLECSK